MSQFLYLKNVSTLQLNREKCSGCGMCLMVCPHNVLERSNGSVNIVELDACMECGACAKNCPTQAITVKAGVGCAQAVINKMLGRKGSACCCVIEDDEMKSDTSRGKSGCC